jgi:murein DD-endopeptidase MepM/ murein hydrolase activator NlpD
MGLVQLNPAITKAPVSNPVQPQEAALRHAAMEFEAVMLTQLTASLNPSDEEENSSSLYSSGGGMGLARQMFSEQLAKTMSQNGGIGLAKMIVGQMTHGHAAAKNLSEKRAVNAARDIRAAPNANSTPARANTQSSQKISNDRYPEAIIISEASKAEAESQPSAVSATVKSSLPKSSVPNRSAPVDVARATRPRRVFDIDRAEATSGRFKPSIQVRGASQVTASHVGASQIAARLAAASHASKPLSSPVSLRLPVHGAIRSVFGPRRDPINGRQRFHKGIDIAAPRGTPIAAAGAGTVIFAGRNHGYGNMVMIEHADGRRTLYGHAERLFVTAGDTVAAGQTIAAVGSTGHSTGPHVHFEVRENNRAVNPLSSLANDLTLARR